MYCQYCGTELPDAANFCYKCGRDRRQPTGKQQPPTYEVCFIDVLFGAVGAFVGEHYRTRQEIARVDYTFDSDRALQKLVARLAAEGWEVLTFNKEGTVTSMRRLKRP